MLSESDWQQIKADFNDGDATVFDLSFKPSINLRAYASSTDLPIICTFKAWLETTEKPKPRTFAEFIVIQGGKRSLLGRKTSLEMKLLAIGLQVNEISEGAKEFPSIPGPDIEFDIDETVIPTRQAYVNIPAAFRAPATARLRKMELEGIIEKVAQSRWVSGLSAVPKGKNDFRLVVNMRGPNKAIVRQHHRMPTPEEIRTKLKGAKLFSKLDITSAFHHLKISERSSELTTFLAPDGMYRFKRLVFGVNCAPEIFQRTMENLFREVEGIIIYIDDILIFAKDKVELDERTEAVLRILSENNLTLNHNKCEYGKETIDFLGHKLTPEGLNIEESKVRDIKNFREPQTVSELKSFLGLATYVSSYIPKFADLTAPLWEATKSKNLLLTKEQRLAFEATKKAVIDCTTTQGYFEQGDEIFLYTDASPLALGAVLTQKDKKGSERIICFASKSLSKTEKKYAQTQREALGIIWAAEHFHYYLLGNHFTIRTDAQGIAFIFKRETNTPKQIMTRAEGWALRLGAFDFKIEFVKGKDNIADPSSRLYIGDEEEFHGKTIPGDIAEITAEIPESLRFGDVSITTQELELRTTEDKELDEVRSAIETDAWPKHLSDFKAVSASLYFANGLLMKSDQAVIPRILRPKTMTVAHRGHPGATTMKSALRDRVWWPGMDRHVDEWVRTCTICATNGRRDPPTPMERSRLPESPWDMIAIDFNGPYAMLGGVLILVVVDCYSRYLLTRPVKSTDFNSTRAALSEIFDTFGYVKTIKSDNGPPFNSRDYEKFCADRGIEIIKSWPLHPQQNGMAERYMQAVNKAMQAATLSGQNFRNELANMVKAHNNATHRTTGKVPNELMFGRKLRHGLPLIGRAAVMIDDEEVRERDWSEKLVAKERENSRRHAKPSELRTGDEVYLKRDSKKKGESLFDSTIYKVIENNKGNVTAQDVDGREVKRDSTFFRKRLERCRGTEPESTSQNEESEEQSQSKTRESRPKRSTRTPKYLENYVRFLEREDVHIKSFANDEINK